MLIVALFLSLNWAYNLINSLLSYGCWKMDGLAAMVAKKISLNVHLRILEICWNGQPYIIFINWLNVKIELERKQICLYLLCMAVKLTYVWAYRDL